MTRIFLFPYIFLQKCTNPDIRTYILTPERVLIRIETCGSKFQRFRFFRHHFENSSLMPIRWRLCTLGNQQPTCERYVTQYWVKFTDF